MKVLHLTNAYPTSSYSSYGIFIKEQIESLVKKNLDINCLFLNAREKGFFTYFISVSTIYTQIKKTKPELIHVHHEFSLIPLFFIYFFIRKIPIVLSILGDLNKRGNFNKFIFLVLSFMAKKIIFKNGNNQLPKKGVYIPNGVNLELFRPLDKIESKLKLGLNKNEVHILFVTAQIGNKIKRYDKFKSTISLLKKKYNINVQELILTGVSRSIVPLYYNASNLLLMTSDHEGSPNAVKESMACNLPIVSTNVGDVKNLFGNTHGLYLSKEGSVEDLAYYCAQAIYVENSMGRQRILDMNLDIESIADSLIKLYNDVINN